MPLLIARRIRRLAVAVALVSSALGCAPMVQAQTLGVYFSAPKQESTDVLGATTESFDGMPLYGYVDESPWAIGTATAVHDREASWIAPATIYGGAGFTGQFLYPGDGVSVQLTPDSQYLGFMWSAGDAGNRVKIFDDADKLVAEFTGQDLIDFLTLPAPTITAVDSVTVYQRSDYFGNPTNAANAGEPYAYVNLLLEGTPAKFGRIEIIGDKFEIDNISTIPTTVVTPGNPWVLVVAKPLIDPAGSITAVDDVVRLVVNTPWITTVATNDTAPLGSQWEKLTDPVNGTLIFNPNGSFTYTPDSNYVGTDEFDYRVCKPAPDAAQCSTAKALITLVEPSDPAAIPTLHEWVIFLMALALAGLGARRLRSVPAR